MQVLRPICYTRAKRERERERREESAEIKVRDIEWVQWREIAGFKVLMCIRQARLYLFRPHLSLTPRVTTEPRTLRDLSAVSFLALKLSFARFPAGPG